MKAWMDTKHACGEAKAWVGLRTPAAAWAKCQRGDWMLWALARSPVDKKALVRICCDVALSVLHLTDDRRADRAIDAALGWSQGVVTAEECRAAAADADDAAADAYAAAAYAAYAAAAAAYAAYAAYDAAAAAYAAAAYAAYAAADADDAAAGAYAWRQARAEAQAEIANIIRERISPEAFAALIDSDKVAA